MIVVPARKEPSCRTYASLAVGDTFRFCEDGPLYLRFVSACYSLDSYQRLHCDESGKVIPARVILVEKGADIEDIVKALEAL